MIIIQEFSSTEMNEYKLYRNNIYAGLVVKEIKGDNKNKDEKQFGVPIPRLIQTYRKILFTKTYDNKAEDLLFFSPYYNVDEFSNNFNKEEVHINNVVSLGNLLKENKFNETLTDADIKKIYNLYLKYNSQIFKNKQQYLPMTNEEFIKLHTISEVPRFPSEQHYNNFNEEISFKPKVKIFTKK